MSILFQTAIPEREYTAAGLQYQKGNVLLQDCYTRKGMYCCRIAYTREYQVRQNQRSQSSLFRVARTLKDLLKEMIGAS